MEFHFTINGRIEKFLSFNKSLIAAFVLVSVLCLVVLNFSGKISQVFRPWLEKEFFKVEEGIKKELNNISQQTKEIVDSGILNNYIKDGDILNLLSLSSDEIKKRKLGFSLITDSKGIILNRTEPIGVIGDNLFQTTNWGRIISQGREVVSIEKEKIFPLIIVAAYPIKENGRIVGSVSNGYIVNNEYAFNFKEKYLSQETQLAFYSKEEGVIGSTFGDEETLNLLNSYFNLGSDIITENVPNLEKEVKIKGKYYFVKNISFAGVEESRGGVLVFLPSPHFSYALIFAIGISLVFVLLEIIIHRRFFDSRIVRRKHIFFLAIFWIIIFSISAFLTLYKLDKEATKLERPPYLIYNAILKMEPEADVIDRFFEKRVAIKVSSGGEAINAIQVKLKFDPKIAEVKDIITTKSFCKPELFIRKEIDNENGIVEIICGLPTPGFQEQVGTVAELIIQPLGIGQLVFKFEKDTGVFANDGLGTNVLRMTVNGFYQITSYDKEQSIKEGPLPIFSYTHPNTERWYKKKEIYLAWPHLIDALGYRYALNQIPDFVPTENNFTKENNLTLKVEKDGIYYFHLFPVIPGKENATETLSHLKVMIDSNPPFPAKILVSQQEINAGEMVRFNFTTQDELSGLQEGFYVKFGSWGQFLPIKPPLYIPFLEKGEYLITIRSFDRAGNFSDSSVKIKVK